MSENVLYILIRQDLPSLSSGRAAAQASHASNAFWHKFGSTKGAKEWAASTKQGFGTAIVLGIDGPNQIGDLLDKVEPIGYACELVVDPDYVISISSEVVPFLDQKLKGIILERSKTDPNKYIIHRSEITCAYIFGDKEALQPILGGLPLYS